MSYVTGLFSRSTSFGTADVSTWWIPIRWPIPTRTWSVRGLWS